MEKEVQFKTPLEIRKAFEEMKSLVNQSLEESLTRFTEKGVKAAATDARRYLMDIVRDYAKPLRDSIQYVKNNMPKK